jgi:succinate dehydrogenase flavin-adding protein (antitoxin of CptAB toxin-antitoxin module)
VEDQVYRSHPLASRRRRLFEYRKRERGEHNTDFVKALMMQAKEAELVNMTADEMVIYLTLDKVSDMELVRKLYDKAEARAEAKQLETAQYKVTMEDLLDLAEKLEALEASIQVHMKKAPKEQKDTAKAVNTKLPKKDQSRGREGGTCYKCGKVGHFWSNSTESNILCSKCKSTYHATSMSRKEPEVKTVDKIKDKKERQGESRKTKEDDNKAEERKKRPNW